MLWSDSSLTEFHEQGQKDPHGDLKRLPDVVVVEGEHGESLFRRSRVAMLRRVLAWDHVRMAPRLIVASIRAS